jgi:hypothetical protein
VTLSISNNQQQASQSIARGCDDTRRQLLKSLLYLASPSSALLPFAATSEAVEPQDYFASGVQFANGDYGLAIVDGSGKLKARLALPSRAHGMAHSARKNIGVVFARRPGNYAVVWKLSENSGLPARAELEIVTKITAVTGRHFYGHGAFSADGRWLYASENNFAADNGDGKLVAGIIGVYDAQNGYQRVMEISSGGIGPHEIIVSADGTTLFVANGGIATHPARGREKLNLDTMRSNITAVPLRDGLPDITNLRQWLLPAHSQRLSLRHLVEDGLGNIWIGGQYQSDIATAKISTDTPLVARISAQQRRTSEPLQSLELPEISSNLQDNLRHYISSVAYNPVSNTVIFTAAKGQGYLQVSPFSLSTEVEGSDKRGDAFTGFFTWHDSGEVSGVAATTTRVEALSESAMDSGWRMTTGKGEWFTLWDDGAEGLSQDQQSQGGRRTTMAFDNHLLGFQLHS